MAMIINGHRFYYSFFNARLSAYSEQGKQNLTFSPVGNS